MRKTRSSNKVDLIDADVKKPDQKTKNGSNKPNPREKIYNAHQKRVLERQARKATSCSGKIEKNKKINLKLKNSSPPITKKAKKNKPSDENCIENNDKILESISSNSTSYRLSGELSEKSTPCKEYKRNSMEKRLKNLRNSLSKNLQNQNAHSPKNVLKFKDLDPNNSLNYSKDSINLDRTPQNIFSLHNYVIDSNKEVIQRKGNENNTCLMDWEEMDENSMNTQISCDKSDDSFVKLDNKFIVVDTNILLKHLRTIQNVINDNIMLDNFSLKFVIPWRVLCELDGLKGNENSSNVSIDSRIALKYLHENLTKSNNILGQSLKDANDHVFECPTPDDEILNCCLQLALKKKNVALLSNDISLCNKGMTNDIQTFTHEKFVEQLCNQSKITLTPSKSLKCINSDKNIQIFEMQLKILNHSLRTLLSAILKEEMITRYDELWLKIVYLEPPWSLIDVIKCIKKHWIAVFSENFSKLFLDILGSLQKHFTQAKAVRKENTENIDEIKTLALELCEICVKLPTYKIISTSCMEEIKKLTKPEPVNPQSIEFVQNKVSISKRHLSTPDNNNRISNGFQVISDGFNAFCSQLANLVGVPHDIKTTEMNIPIPTLLAHANDVSAQLSKFIDTLHRTLSVFAANATATEVEINEVLINLKEVVISTSRGMGHQVDYDDKDIASFCILERNLIEKTFLHFSALYELLLKCSKKCSNK